MAAEDDVRAASQRYYEALNAMLTGDASSMTDVWSHGSGTTAIHPIGDREKGWGAIRRSFEQVAQLASDGSTQIEKQMITVAGDLAYELGVERGSAMVGGEAVSIENRVTNIYRREGGAWKMVHHHADRSEAMVALIERFRAAG